MSAHNYERYAVAVRDGADCLLFLWVKRMTRGDVYGFLPRPHDTSINAHASYHRDGRYHFKSHDMSSHNKIMAKRMQPPDHNFMGTEHLLEQTIKLSNVRSIGEACDPNDFSAVFEIPAKELESKTSVRVTSDLVSPGHNPNLIPGVRVIKQEEYRNHFPYLVLTLYETPEC